MSALMEQHERWAAARERLWHGAAADTSKPLPARPASPFSMQRIKQRRMEELAAAFPRRQLFTAPIVEIDEFGNVIDDMAPLVPRAHWRTIALEVSRKHGVTLLDMVSPRRSAKLVAARYEAFWRCRNETTMTLPQIGRRFGDMDHTTVLYGVRKHERRMREQANG